MHIPSTIRTSFGPRALPCWPLIHVPLTPEELRARLLTIERGASDAERNGDLAAAHQLSWRAGAFREAAR